MRVPASAPPAKAAESPPPASESPRELTASAIIIGVVIALIFAAASLYIALEAGIVVSASIPVAVLSVTMLRSATGLLGAPTTTILENNLVQTMATASELVAAGVAFTLPALLLLGDVLPWTRVSAIGVVGGVLGVLMFAFLPPSLADTKRESLAFPEARACAQVLVGGEKSGHTATILLGLGLGAAYKFVTAGLHLFLGAPGRSLAAVQVRGQSQLFGDLRANVSAELTGLGYLIGARVAGRLLVGGVLASFVVVPVIKLFGASPATRDIPPTTAASLLGAGAIGAAAVMGFARMLPAIMRSSAQFTAHTDCGLPTRTVVAGMVACLVATMVLLNSSIGVVVAILAVAIAAILVALSARVTGVIGASANPVSGMTVATLVLISLVFVASGLVGREYRVMTLLAGGVVCVATATSGAAAQALRAGHLVGATPRLQHAGLLVGVCASAFLAGFLLPLLNGAMTTIVPRTYPAVRVSSIDETGHYALANGRMMEGGGPYRVARLDAPRGPAVAGRYLVDDVGSIRYLVDPGIGGRERTNYDGQVVAKLDAPQARLMALVVNSSATNMLPWSLVLVGAALAGALELVGMSSLPVAVGLYLPLPVSAALFGGGAIRWLAERSARRQDAEAADAEGSRGVLFSSGLIAGGSVAGIVLAGLAARHFNEAFDLTRVVGPIAGSNVVSMIGYVVLLAVPLYVAARRVRSSTS